jgi:hypothetical protein
MPTYLRTIAGQFVALTGRAWIGRLELRRKVLRAGGRTTPRDDVSPDATVLVKGTCPVWKYGDYGRKEQRAANLVRSGHLIAVVHDFEFRKVLEQRRPARVNDRIAGQPVEWLRTATRRQFERAAEISGPLDREHSVMGRVEQSFLRRQLFADGDEGRCCLCGRRLPTSLLVAAHIKPRSDCSRRERLDAEHIVFGVCLLGCDALYERGLVSVRPGGEICVSESNVSASLGRVLRAFSKRKCSAWKDATAPYFEWHFRRRFQG